MEQTASYLLLVRDTTPEVYETMTAAETRRCLDHWNAWVDGMAATGALKDGRPLGAAGRLVSGARGEKVTDGPFAEAKELVGGYFLLEDLTLDDATAIAQRCPLLPYGMTVEVRPVAAVCHLASALGWETMREPVSPRRAP